LKSKGHISQTEIHGLTDAEVFQQRALNGSNQLKKEKNLLLQNLLSVIKEPMFILLLIACAVYFSISEFSEAYTMLFALFFVAGIDVFQNFRTQKALKAISRLTETKTKVIRNAETIKIDTVDLVTKDVIICEEGTIVPADAEILTSNDFSIDESILTGESISVEKFSTDTIFQGTLVVRGYCYAKVSAVGKQTTLGGIGELVSSTAKEKTPLQSKVSNFVRSMVIIGSIAFLFVWGYNWWESGSALHGLIHGLTMAMSVLPEEIPVALSTFMAFGAYRLLKHGIITRSPKTVETLGSATVICLDKTGTLTQNLMNVTHTFSLKTNREIAFDKSPKPSEVLEYAMWASEENPFDPMEKSIHNYYAELFKVDERKNYRMVKEFPLSGKPPVMTHVFQNENKKFIIGCKGALEGVLKLCSLSPEQKDVIHKQGLIYAKNGLRVLGIAKGHWDSSDYPELQKDIEFEFLGLITFWDPPTPDIKNVINGFYAAGLDVKMITGDYKETAVAIAKQSGIKLNKVLTGSELAELSDEALKEMLSSVNVFARIDPETKLRIINVLKQTGQIVSMTGDGVNDAPALKSAHIGIAMGSKGTDVAKGAAGLILSNNDLSKMIDAIFLGRRINENLTKAIRYIISIHIPIILLVMLPIFFKWLPSQLFSPIHVIFLELIMGPTCSIVYENENIPKEKLKYPVDSRNKNLLQLSQLWITIVQGLMITVGCLIIGYYGSYYELGELKIRSLIFSTLIFSNILLTLINRSFSQTIFQTIKQKNRYVPVIIGISIILLLLIFNVPYITSFFSGSPLQFQEYLFSFLIAFLFTIWIEPVKYLKGRKESVKPEPKISV
jgi:Ca2+-transporting ATPase